MTDTLVLAYHAVSSDWPWRFSVTPGQLESHLRRLRARGYRPVTFAQATQPGDGRRVAVTFDDAFASVAELAFPLLRRYGFTATVFAVTDFVGAELPVPDGDERRAASWEQLGELAAAGWEVGSHTRTHAALTEVDDARLDDELRGSKAAVEAALGRPCTTLAYPYGATDDRVRDAVRRAGYEAAADFPPRFEGPTAFGWPRVGVYREDGARRFALKVSPIVRRLRAAR